MITRFLIEHPWMSPVALALLLVLGPSLGAWAAAHRRAGGWLTALTLAFVAIVTLFPTNDVLATRCEVAWANPTDVEPLANVVLFVAPVLLAAAVTRRPLLALVAGSALSAIIEAAQALVPILARTCSTTDWQSNTIGAAIGAVLAAVALRRLGERRQV